MNNNPDCCTALKAINFFLFETSIHCLIQNYYHHNPFKAISTTWRNILNPTKTFTKFASPINLDRLPHPSHAPIVTHSIIYVVCVIFVCRMVVKVASFGHISMSDSRLLCTHIFGIYLLTPWFIYTQANKHIVLSPVLHFVTLLLSSFSPSNFTHSFHRYLCIFT